MTFAGLRPPSEALSGAAANDRQVKLLLKYNGFNKVSTRISTRLAS
jgi:hypothetical protein